jgi:hypothetical protein
MPLIGHAKHHFRGACGAYNVILRRLRRANDDLDEVCGLHRTKISLCAPQAATISKATCVNTP